MEEGREQAGAAMGMGTATHRALVIVGTTEVRSRREDLHEGASAELEQRRQPRDQGAMLW